MKKGFFFTLPKILILPTALFCLSGCASFLQLGEPEDDPYEYDRGYRADARSSNDDEDTPNTEAMVRRDPASSDFPKGRSHEQDRIKEAIEMRDVVLGMTRHQVMESWGQPAQREVAGRGIGGHERWIYGSRYSLSGSRTVIFENGRVAGWSH